MGQDFPLSMTHRGLSLFFCFFHQGTSKLEFVQSYCFLTLIWVLKDFTVCVYHTMYVYVLNLMQNMFLLKKKLMILTGIEISLAGVGRGLPLLQLTMTASLKKILELYLFQSNAGLFRNKPNSIKFKLGKMLQFCPNDSPL